MVLPDEDAVFSKDRLRAYGITFAVGYAVLFASLYALGFWIRDSAGRLVRMDFDWIWTGARLVWAGTGRDVYHYPDFAAAQHALLPTLPPDYLDFHWMYPPSFLLIAAPFGLLDFGPSLLVWVVLTLCVYMGAMTLILRGTHWSLMALTPCPVALNLLQGHAAYLSAGLIGLACALIETAPFAAGLLLGVLAYKPQFGLLFPIVLLAAGRWRVIAGAAVSVALFGIVATVLFGIESWTGFLAQMSEADPRTLLPATDGWVTMQSVHGLMIRLGGGTALAWTCHLAVAAGTVVLVCRLWRGPAPHALKAAALSAGALLVTPYLISYDLVSAVVPAAFLVGDGLSRGFLPGERSVLALCFALLFLSVVPIGAVVLMALLGLAVRRAAAPGGAPGVRANASFTAAR
jgi:hypothetical protein